MQDTNISIFQLVDTLDEQIRNEPETNQEIMTKATEASVFIVFFTSVYIGLVAGVFPVDEKIKQEILPYLPFWALVTFGSYALGTLGWGVFTFKDKEEKYKELLVQIDEAKEFYKSKGINLD